jgi:hypothetical protein
MKINQANSSSAECHLLVRLVKLRFNLEDGRKISVNLYQTTLRHILEDITLHSTALRHSDFSLWIIIQLSEELTYPNEAFEEQTNIMSDSRPTFTFRLQRGFEWRRAAHAAFLQPDLRSEAAEFVRTCRSSARSGHQDCRTARSYVINNRICYWSWVSHTLYPNHRIFKLKIYHIPNIQSRNSIAQSI